MYKSGVYHLIDDWLMLIDEIDVVEDVVVASVMKIMMDLILEL